MRLLRYHWFDLGIAFAVGLGVVLLVVKPHGLDLLLWLSLISLFVHQFEEYRCPGYFPGMINSVMYSSERPDRYPLNANTALIINVGVGWTGYLLAAILAETALWLAVATIVVSAGNIVAHTLLFNVKGRTVYNPGMLTALLLFLPITVYFFVWVIQSHTATPFDWIAGVILGLALTYLGILKAIDWLKDEGTGYVFPERCLLPGTRREL